MILPSGVSSSCSLREAGAGEDADPEEQPALEAKTRHFRIIMQISITVGKRFDV